MKNPTTRRLLLGLAPLCLLWLSACGAAAAPEHRVSLEQARELMAQGQVRVYDIRESSEHATGVAQGMALLPMSQLRQRIGEIPQDPTQPVLLICNTQNRSSKVVQAMREAGWTNVRYVHGGMSEWAQRGWPLFKPMGVARP